MSDSDDLSTPVDIPADSEIEQCLRRVVRDASKKDEQISINNARTRAEAELGLDAGFLKDNQQWKSRSKDLITAAFEEPPSPEKPKKSAPKPKAKPAAKAGTKRKSDEAQPKTKKRQKKSPSPVADSEDDEVPANGASDGTLESAQNHVMSKLKSQPKSEQESALSEPPEEATEPAAPKTNGRPKVEDDESDLSSVIDDPPPKKKGRQKKSTSPSDTKAKPKSQKSSKPKPEKAKPDLSPDEEEIKRLQSWLVKCGIRKLWHNELKQYSTSKEKIKHLKRMLDDVGLTGRFSTEKAKQIKEARELKAELEAAREFNEQWGHESGSGEDEEDKNEKDGTKQPPRRSKPKGLIDFGDSDEDSE